LLRAHGGEEQGTTAITAYELALGATTSARRRSALELLEALEVLPLDSAVAWAAGEEMRARRRLGEKAPLRDLVIGMIAREAGYALHTNDRKFPPLEGLDLLVL
jgi:predicted nucleic acid-binding protein